MEKILDVAFYWCNLETFMKKLITLFAILAMFTPVVNAKEYFARVTYYWTGHITSLGKKPVSGHTIAVDPKIIPYGSRVHIPAMSKIYVAGDTGSAVKSRLAARKLGKPEAIVVDVYCSSKGEAAKLIKKHPMFMKVWVEKK